MKIRDALCITPSKGYAVDWYARYHSFFLTFALIAREVIRVHGLKLLRHQRHDPLLGNFSASRQRAVKYAATCPIGAMSRQ